MKRRLRRLSPVREAFEQRAAATERGRASGARESRRCAGSGLDASCSSVASSMSSPVLSNEYTSSGFVAWPGLVAKVPLGPVKLGIDGRYALSAVAQWVVST